MKFGDIQGQSLFWLALLAECATGFVVTKLNTVSSTAFTATSLPDYEVDKIKLEPKKKKWRREDLFGSSIVDQTLQELEEDDDFQATKEKLKTIGQEGMSKEERTQRRRALDNLGIEPFAKFLRKEMGTVDGKPFVLKRQTPTILQINIGLYCNQACGHCHVESSPLRTEEMMTADTAAQCLALLKNTQSITTLDITGGAPELNENFRYLVKMARSIRPDLEIIDRCNLTVLQEPGQEDLVEFLKENKVHIIASLPCYSEENVDQQRGNGVFERSIAALLALNDAGYSSQSDLRLDLVYNPLGAFLPPPQEKLEVQYKQQLADNFGILFDSLFTITNMPIKRFADFLHRRDELQGYMDLLVRNFNKDTVENLMCLETISVGWDGKIYDCDFNQQLGYAIGVDSIHRGGKTVFDLESLDELIESRIRTDNHCFGCTAGMGSS
ncbi:unnamed protein product [Cylindrotheca closterium]|uniref:DUF3641 domain-containing protein n=1 Tax=Cylindrotheca closterium TaxID=2856 RepID=A0AAD2G3I0_9STRA|nr:unnamed protein product [Cylindrotheca closterium]